MNDYLRHEFSAMGTTVSLMAPDAAAPGQRAEFELTACVVEVVFSELEGRFSRFRSDSELSRLNARGDTWTRVSRPLADVLALAIASAQETEGLFDPTVLDALVAAGYDRDWDQVQAGVGAISGAPSACGRWREIQLEGRMARLSNGVHIDLGGLAKGWTVDRAAEAAAALPWAVVNAGGDLRLIGGPPTGGLEVGVEDPADPSHQVVRLLLEEGAVATSSILSRTWGTGMHELIDPRTARPASTGVVQATVWAPTCAQAEIRSTWAMLAGAAILDRFPGVLVMDDGRVLLNLEPGEGDARAKVSSA